MPQVKDAVCSGERLHSLGAEFDTAPNGLSFDTSPTYTKITFL